MESLIRALKKEKHPLLIQTHDFPDYDAIASAYGLQIFLKTRGIQSDICYAGKIPLFVREVFLKSLKIDLYPVNAVLDKQRPALVVDSNPYSGNLTPLQNPYWGFIDHHTSNYDSSRSYPFIDVRKIGSTSSVISSYFQHGRIAPSVSVATALAVGLFTDTFNLIRGVCPEDLEAYAFLFPHVDTDIMKMSVINKLTLGDLDYYKKAIDSLKIYNTMAVITITGVNDRNLLGIMADFFLSLMEVSSNLMVNTTEEGTHLSCRSLDPSLNAARIVKLIVRGRGSGGGHSYMAGGFIPGHVDIHEIHAIIEEIVNENKGG
jgi:nanoRNase/pAp phosphatase (c-di-AMP/oligoRNAs hydrolase)